MDLKTIRTLWWKVGLINVGWCAALWAASQGLVAAIPFLSQIKPAADPPVFGPLVGLPLLVFCGWLGIRHVKRVVTETPCVVGLNRAPQPPELVLEGPDGLVIRLLANALVYLFPFFACTHLIRKLMFGNVYRRGLVVPNPWSLYHLTVFDGYRFEQGPTYFPVLQPLLYMAFLGVALALIVIVFRSARAMPSRVESVTP